MNARSIGNRITAITVTVLALIGIQLWAPLALSIPPLKQMTSEQAKEAMERGLERHHKSLKVWESRTHIDPFTDAKTCLVTSGGYFVRNPFALIDAIYPTFIFTKGGVRFGFKQWGGRTIAGVQTRIDNNPAFVVAARGMHLGAVSKNAVSSFSLSEGMSIDGAEAEGVISQMLTGNTIMYRATEGKTQSKLTINESFKKSLAECGVEISKLQTSR